MLTMFAALLQLAAPVQGTVRAAGSLEPVPYAIVEVIGTQRRAAADVRGFFTIADVPAGRQTIRARAIGYTPVQQVIDVAEGTVNRLELLLAPLAVTIEAVSVIEETDRVEAAGPPPVRLDVSTLRMSPALGEADVLRALQTLPSVQQASDFSGALYVRGGSPDQTLVTLDGMPLFNPYHLGGIFAAIDPDAVATLDVFPGAIPARLGDRLSGMVQIWTREGGRDRARSSGSIGLISTRASVDGPLPGAQGSYLVSVRRTYLDLFTQAMKAFGAIDQSLPYHFTDAHLKLVRDVGELGRLSASAYYDAEELSNPDPLESDDAVDDGFDWGSRALSLDWRQPLGGRFLLEARTGFSSFRSEIDFFDQSFESPGPPVQTMRGRAYMRDALASAGLTTFLRDHELRGGVQLDAYRLDYDVTRAEDRFFADLLPELQRADRRTTLAAYLEDEWRFGEALRVRVGARSLTSGGLTVVMPRFGAVWRLRSDLTVEVGGGTYAQALHSFRNEESILASYLAYDVLTPSDSTGLSRSADVVIGAEWRDESTSIRVDAYEKRFTDLAIPRLPPDPFEAPLLEVEQVERGTGNARGVELLLRRGLGDRRAIWASYALSAARREVGGERFTPRFDRRHTLDVTSTFPIRRRTDGGARLVAASGQPYTPVIGRFLPVVPGTRPGTPAYETSLFPVFVLGEHNSAALPGYWRLDLSLRRSSARRVFGRDGTLTWVVQVINALNTRNVLAAQPDAFGFSPGGQLTMQPQLPIVPSIALEWKF